MVEVVFSGVSIFGLHTVHLMSNQAIDLEKQVQQYVGGPERGKLEVAYSYEEETLRIHHLRLYWREVKDGQVVPGLCESLISKYAENGGRNGKR